VLELSTEVLELGCDPRWRILVHDAELGSETASSRSEPFVNITSTAVSLNVEDVPAASAFLVERGFSEQMAADGFASLGRDDVGANVIFLRRGLQTLPADQRDELARGLILAFVVEDLEGERAFQVRDPNGVIVQLLDWNGPTSQ
jgi:hypothetical protein